MADVENTPSNQPLNSQTAFLQQAGELAEVCGGLASYPSVAIDTEFERSRTFYARPALLQIGDGARCWLVDPLSIDDFSAFGRLVGEAGVLKILHSAGEDLELIGQMTGQVPQPLFDTQIAAALVGYGFSMGYQRLVNQVCGVALPKGETRSNWLRRPLSAGQREYATQDVAYLHQLHAHLDTELVRLNRTEWLREECRRQVERAERDEPADEAYRRIGVAWRLTRPELGVLKSLCAWREREIRIRDLPRAHLIRDEVLVRIAQQQPDGPGKLASIEGLATDRVGRYAEKLLSIVAAAASIPLEQQPEPLTPPLDTRAFSPLLKRLQSVVRQTAGQLDLAPEILAHRRSLEALIRRVKVDTEDGLTSFFRGWREEVVGRALLAAIEQS